MAKKKKDKKKDEGSGLPQAAIHMAETVAGLIGSPTGRQIMAEALRAAADALARDRTHADQPAEERAVGTSQTTAEVAVGIVGDAATRLVSAMVSGESGKASNGQPEKRKRRSKGTNSAAGPASGSTDDPPPVRQPRA